MGRASHWKLEGLHNYLKLDFPQFAIIILVIKQFAMLLIALFR